MSVDFAALLAAEYATRDAAHAASRCSKDWLTVEWEPDMQMKVTVVHHCALAPHATGNHRDAAGNVRVRFEE